MATPQAPIPPNNNVLSLLIVAKAKMNTGLCYMGYDTNNKKFLRPLYSVEEDNQCWPREYDFIVGEKIEFEVIRSHPEQSSLPHRDIDVLVKQKVNRLNPADVLSPKEMFETLSELSFTTVTEIFGNEYSPFVKEGSACPSVGIYSCEGKNVNIQMSKYKDKRRRRCIIIEPSKQYNLSITAEERYQQPTGDDIVLLLLGLARPWTKEENPDGEGKKCYILVIGMVTKPSGSDTC